MQNSILFVCLGNICRSPLAEGIAKKMVIERGLDIKVASAGTSSWHVGEPPCSNSVTIAKRYGVDISDQRAQQVTPSLLKEYRYIIALDANNLQDLKKMGVEDVQKLLDEDVPDPYFFDGNDTLDGFERVYKMIEKGVKELLLK